LEKGDSWLRPWLKSGGAGVGVWLGDVGVFTGWTARPATPATPAERGPHLSARSGYRKASGGTVTSLAELSTKTLLPKPLTTVPFAP
jgi:hypothetical protein